MVLWLREDIKRLQDSTLYYEELVEDCIKRIEDSTTATSGRIREMNKRLKDMAHNIQNGCAHDEEGHCFEPLIARYKSIMEHGGASSSNQIASISDNNRV